MRWFSLLARNLIRHEKRMREIAAKPAEGICEFNEIIQENL
jgi:hypothetical protein